MEIYRKIHFILSSSQRKFLVTLFFLMLIGMVFETFGIALIFPILAVITKEGVVESYPIIGTIINYFGISPTRREIVLSGVIFMISIYTLKTAYLLFLTWRQNIFLKAILMIQSFLQMLIPYLQNMETQTKIIRFPSAHRCLWRMERQQFLRFNASQQFQEEQPQL